MASISKLERIPLKNHNEINEALIQKYIFDDPSVLGLGELVPLDRERIQTSGGRLDLLFRNSEGDRRYEVEIQLDKTDESHIIRTIEYWDTEKKRFPQYDHYAVIVAEEITGRLFNVISLFNGSIPLYAFKMTAYKSHIDGEIHLTFTKVLDVVRLGTDEEDVIETTDRNYWENERSSKNMLKLVDHIFESLLLKENFDLRYTKYYIGLTDKKGIARNFISMVPRKKAITLYVRLNEDEGYSNILDASGLDARYVSRNGEYEIRFNNIEDYKKHEEAIRTMAGYARKRMVNDE